MPWHQQQNDAESEIVETGSYTVKRAICSGDEVFPGTLAMSTDTEHRSTQEEFQLEIPEHFNFAFDVVGKRAREGKTYKGLPLYEAPYQPETLQFYKIKGVGNTTNKGYNFNRELRRVGYGYTVDRKILLLD